MFPTPQPPPPAAMADHRHPTVKEPKRLQLRTTPHAVKSQISIRHFALLALLQLLFLLLLLLSRPSPSPAAEEATCPLGRVYIYDLPTAHNHDLLSDCENLDPWSSLCNAISNGGFGPPAASLGPLVPSNLAPAWRWTDMYAGEVIYHDRLTSYRCTTPDPAKATAFYIPFYAGLAVGRYLFENYTTIDRDRHAILMLNWVKTQDPFLRSNGSDHFIMLGRLTWDFRRLTDNDREWGTNFLLLPSMKNVLRLGVERSPWDPLEISVPYPTAFHPRSGSDIRQWQDFIRAQNRASLFTFVGAARKKIQNDFRGLLINYCRREQGSCRLVDCSLGSTKCSDGSPAMVEAFLGSDFCLQPKGDGFTRRSAFDCMVAGSIPVFFWRESFESQYEWHLPKDGSAYSVFIDRWTVRNESSVIKRVLEKYSREEVRRMREVIIEVLPRLLYWREDTSLECFNDAFDVAIEAVLRRFRKQKMGKI